MRSVSAWQTGLLLTPAAVLGALVMVVPVFIVTVMAFTDWQFGAAGLRWVGLGNFVELFNDAVFRLSVWNTFIYLLIVTTGSLVLGLLAAVLIESQPSFRTFYRTAYFLPVASTMIAMAVVWQFLLHPTLGLVNLVLAKFGLQGRDWLNDTELSLFVLAGIGIWQMSGLVMVLFMAGLKSVPRDILHAAELDGIPAGWERFWRIVWPLLGPTTLFVVTICTVRALQVFDTVHVLTQGGPSKSTEVILHSIYSEGFGFFRMGYASAMTLLFVLAIFVLTKVQNRIMEKRTHYT